jgi:ligand-binding sensor domain-containing protein
MTSREEPSARDRARKARSLSSEPRRLEGSIRLRRMTSLIIAMTLVSAVPSFAGTNRWTTSGPAGASISALVNDPLDSRIVYAATSGAGIFRSMAAGEPQWEPVNTGLTERAITAIAINAAAPEMLYAGTARGVVFRSGDRGEHWAAVNEPTGEYVHAISIDGKRRRIFVATDAGVLTSGVDEETWRAVPQLRGVFYSVAVAADGAIYASSFNAVYASRDGGETWTNVLTSSGNDTQIVGVASDPENATIYAVRSASIQASIDSGLTWQQLPVIKGGTRSLLAVRGDLYAATDRGAYVYDRASSRWQRVGSFSGAVTAVALAASTPSRLFAGTKAGVLTAFQPGSEWRTANNGMNAAFVLDLAAVEDDVVYATTHDGLFQSMDGAATWRKVPGVDEPLAHSGGGSGCCIGASIATSGAKTIYVAGKKGIQRSTDQALTWTTVTPGSASALAVSSDSTLYAAFSDGLAKSADGGNTWHYASAGIFETTYGSYSWLYLGASVLETDADEPSVVHVAYGEGAFKTSSAGESWKRIFGQPSPHNSFVEAIAARGPIAHLAASGHGITTSVDGASTWSSDRLTGEHVLALALDPLDSSRSYAGTESGRVYRSDDIGHEWILFGDALPASVVRLAINDSGDRIYAGTTAGVFVYQIDNGVSLERLPDDALRLPSLMQQLVAVAPPQNAAAVIPAVAFILPAVGTVRGSAGTIFRTDVALSNARSTAQNVTVAWLPQGNLGGSVVPMFRVHLPPSVDDSVGTLTISDIADELRVSGLGSMVVFAVDDKGQLDPAADIDGSARVRSPSSCGSGSVSQSSPAITSLGPHRKARALGLRHESAYRTNVGIVNVGEFPRQFTILVNGERHSERFTVSVAPFSLMHAAVPDANYGPISVTVISDERETPWAAYGSSVDNASGDSWTSVAAPRRDR